MKMIPIFRCSNMKEALAFYTGILDFKIKEAGASEYDWVVVLQNRDAELMLTILEGDQKMGIATNVIVDNVDEAFERYTKRGLDQSHMINSPVHLGPTNQSWGTREFYITDKDRNTLRFVQPLH